MSCLCLHDVDCSHSGHSLSHFHLFSSFLLFSLLGLGLRLSVVVCQLAITLIVYTSLAGGSTFCSELSFPGNTAPDNLYHTVKVTYCPAHLNYKQCPPRKQWFNNNWNENTRQKKDWKEQIYKYLILTPFYGIFSGSFKSNSRNSWWPKPPSNPGDQRAMKVRSRGSGTSTGEDFQLGKEEQLVGVRRQQLAARQPVAKRCTQRQWWRHPMRDYMVAMREYSMPDEPVKGFQHGRWNVSQSKWI